MDAATSATESIMVRLTAVFQTSLRMLRSAGDLATLSRLSAPADTTAWPEMAMSYFGISLRIVLTVIVCPMEIAMALHN